MNTRVLAACLRTVRVAAEMATVLLLSMVSLPSRALAQVASPSSSSPSTSLKVSGSAEPKAIPAALVAERYVIAANDILLLKVYQEDDLETKAKVTREGTITLPLLGPVSVAGLTLAEAIEKIRMELDRRFIVNPQVNLTVAEFSKRKCTILGQVQRPGIYEYSGEEPMTLMQAVGFAGGLTRLASSSRMTLQRMEKGQYKTIKLKSESLGQSEGATSPLILQPDDVITVGTRLF